MTLTGATTLVTGASSGLGRCIALDLARRGATVLLVARDAERLDAVRRSVEDAGGRARVARVDVTDEAAARAALARLVADSPLRLAVLAAGVLDLGPVEELDAARLRRVLDVNVVGTSIAARALLGPLASGRGRLVVVSSISGLLVLPGGFSAYAASKWGLRAWCETARPELAARRIGLTVAHPGTIDTPMVSGMAERGPGVYRAFGWHAPEAVAKRIVRDALRGRGNSYTSWVERSAAFAHGVAPRATAWLLRTLAARRDRGAR